jgi:anti-anti-sigma factor
LVQNGVFVHYYPGGDILTHRVSCVTADQAVSGGKSNVDMMATIEVAQALQLELAYQVAADGRATVRICGELDIATADQAYAYLRDVVDSQSGPVTMNLAELTFCDAAGLGVLARVAGHARRSGRSIKLAAARPSMVRIMRITGMDEAFPEVRGQALAMISWPRQASVVANN